MTFEQGFNHCLLNASIVPVFLMIINYTLMLVVNASILFASVIGRPRS